MSSEQSEHFFACPYCATRISMLLDLSVERQTFVEDCENCCHPIEVSYAVVDGAPVEIEIRRIQ